MMDRTRLEDERRWGYLRALVERVARADQATVLDDCLDLLVEFFGADRGLVVLAEPNGTTCTIHARGKGRALSAYECEEISRTVIREVFERGEHVLWPPSVDRGDRLTREHGLAGDRRSSGGAAAGSPAHARPRRAVRRLP